ncbi:hypothetical protein HMPREF9413_5390 [Paenibacillus sp. HGF7]|nr:hypothetical protein HMPREF9413_5390 [Paenibacillus sp. HGF7]
MLFSNSLTVIQPVKNSINNIFFIIILIEFQNPKSNHETVYCILNIFRKLRKPQSRNIVRFASGFECHRFQFCQC